MTRPVLSLTTIATPFLPPLVAASILIFSQPSYGAIHGSSLVIASLSPLKARLFPTNSVKFSNLLTANGTVTAPSNNIMFLISQTTNSKDPTMVVAFSCPKLLFSVWPESFNTHRPKSSNEQTSHLRHHLLANATLRIKGQLVKRCKLVSSSLPHMLHIFSPWPNLDRSTIIVGKISEKARHKKILNLSCNLDFQSRIHRYPKAGKSPIRWYHVILFFFFFFKFQYIVLLKNAMLIFDWKWKDNNLLKERKRKIPGNFEILYSNDLWICTNL